MNAIVFLPLSRGQCATIDFDDFEKVGRVKWYALKSRRGFYAVRTVKVNGRKQMQYMHRVLLGLSKPFCADHKNGDGLDNRRENLRPASNQENTQGAACKRISATSIFRGVHWDRSRKKWEAKISPDGRTLHLGRFSAERAAAEAYDKKARELGFKPEALNFPVL
jgi:hypothetical protein